MYREFENKVAVVTGASRGIGLLLTRLLADAGAKVAFAARSEAPIQALEAQLRTQGCDVMAMGIDVGVHADCERLIETTAQRWGRIDLLINNAGLSGVQKPIHELSYSEFDEVVRANQYSVYSCTHFAARHMIAHRSGVIINVSSNAALRPGPRRTSYVSSKRGLTGITCTAAHDLGPFGIRCNTVSPGPVAGVRLDEVVARASVARNVPPEVVANEYLSSSPMNEFVTDQDICDTILFLCSDRARHITGQDIAVNAGTVIR